MTTSKLQEAIKAATGTASDQDVAEFVSFLLHVRTHGHMLHLVTDSHEIHIALDPFYSGFGDFADEICEFYMGRYNQN